MGYQITWKVKDLPELSSEFKTYYSKDPKDNITELKNELIIDCMNYDKQHVKLKELKFKLDLFVIAVQESWKWNLQESLKDAEEYWMCGWEYSHDDYTEDDSFLNTLYKDIYMYAFCTEPQDVLDPDSNFWTKYNKIESELDSLEEFVYNQCNHKFVDTYREYRIKYDDEG